MIGAAASADSEHADRCDERNERSFLESQQRDRSRRGEHDAEWITEVG